MPIKVPVVQTGLEQSIQQAAQKAGKSLKINMGPGAKSIESLSQPLGRLTGKADDFTKSMAAANARVLAFGASVGTIAAVTRGMKELVTTTIEVEKSLANINSILKQSESQLNSFKNNIFDIARNTEQSFANVAEAALELSRQGLKAEQVTKRLNDALILSRISGMNAADSVSGLTAAINSFKSAGLTSAEVLNKISAAAASAAVSDRDLIEGIKRSGAVAVSTGVQFDELVGIISALQEKTARGGAVIGNSLKTIFVRIQDIEKLRSLRDLGVQVTDLEGRVLSSNKVIENLAPAFAKLDQASRVNLADNLVGKFQIAPFLALLEDYNQKISRSNEVASTSFSATNEAYMRNEALNKTLSSAINTATLNLKELANTLGEIGVTDNLRSIIGFFNSIVSNIQGVLDGEGLGSDLAKGLIKGISNIISGPGLALALAVVGKLLIDFAKFGAKSLNVFFGLNKAAERQAKLQGQIASSLINDKTIRQKILDIERLSISAEEKKVLQTQFFTTALNEQLAVMTKMQGIAATIAPRVMTSVPSFMTSKNPFGGKKAADGFLPVGAEKSDISRGVGGAPASAKPVVIPNFAFGGGKRGTMVANSSEYIVPNYANGGDAIFNQNMASSMGLPANAKKVRAASGYIPNFASIQDIIRRPGNYMKADGTFKSNKAAESFRNASQADKDKINQFRNKNQGSKTLIVPADRYGVASLFSSKKTGNSKTSPSLLSSPLAKSAAKAGITDIQFKGIQVRSLHSDNLKDKKTKFKNQIADLFINPVATLGANILGTSFQGNDAKELNNKLKKIKNQGGGANLFSSSVEGGIFESAIRLITKKASGLRAFKDEKDDQKPFDFEEGAGRPSKAFKNTFKFTPSLQKSDGKRTASNEAVRTVIGKAFNDPSQRDFLISQIKKVIPKFRAATGYIPNFAGGALEEAVGREKAAGLPVSQIRINQSGKLRNSQNPMGLAVTNTRDEPTGAIPAARGFIPNFVSGAGIQQTNFKAFADSAKKATDANNKTAKSMDGLTAKFFAVQMGLSLFGSSLNEASKDSTGLTKSFSALAEGAMSALMVFMTMQAFNMPLGGLGSKAVAATRATSVTASVGGFAAGKGNMLSKGVSKLGPLSSGLAKLAPTIGKIAGGFMRFLPVIGTAITAFTLLNPLLKSFGVDIIGSVGKFLGLVKTPAEKAASALGKLADKAEANLLTGTGDNTSVMDYINAARSARESGKTIDEALAQDPKEAFSEKMQKVTKGFSGGAIQNEFLDGKNPVLGFLFGSEAGGQTVNYGRGDGFEGLNLDRIAAMGGNTGRRADQDFVDELRTVERTQQRFINAALLGSLGPEDQKGLENKSAEEIKNIINDLIFSLRQVKAFKSVPDKDSESGFRTVPTSALALFREEEAKAAAFEAAGQTKASERAMTNIHNMLRDAFKSSKQKDQEQQEKNQKLKDSGQLLDVRIAKARLKTAKEIFKVRQSNTDELDMQISKAKALGSLGEVEILNLENAKTLQMVSINTLNKKLDIFSAQKDKLDGMDVDTKALIAQEKELLDLSESGKLTDEKLIEIIQNTLALGGDHLKLKGDGLKLLRQEFKGLNDLNKEEEERNKILGRRRVLNLEAQQNLKAFQIGSKEAATAAAFSVTSQIDKENTDAKKRIASINAQLESGNLNPIQRADAEQRKNRIQSGIDMVAIDSSRAELLKKAQSFQLDDKSSSMAIETGDSLDKIKDFDKVIKVLESSLGNIKDPDALKAKQTEIANLKREKVNLDERARLIKNESELLKNRINAITAQRNQAVTDANFESKNLGRMGLGRLAARRARDAEFIKTADKSLTPEQAIQQGMMERTFQERLDDMKKDPKVINDEFLTKMASTSLTFRDGIVSAFAEGIKGAEDLENALLNAANTFLQSMTQNFVQKFMDQAANESTKGGILGFLGFSEGGKVNGGSGSRDDVPAMLMGGEYVMNKKAVSKYGTGFMSALNSGSIQGFARGGQVRDKEGMFMTPGVNGAGAIRGGANLMSFATQTPLAMGRDDLRGYGAFLGSESARMTGFGRRNNPAFQKVQSAKLQAFQLAGQEIAARQQASDQKVSLGSMLASAAISTLVGYGATQLGSTMGLGSGMSKLIGSSAGNYAGMLTTGAPSSGGAFGAAATEDGAFTNIFSPDPTRYGAGGYKFTATGGAIPRTSGVDTVPAMLSGGEFVMNAAATQNIGAANLQALNSGSTGLNDNSDLVLKLDELIRATEDSQTAGNISITVNGSNGSESSVGGQGASEEQRNLSEKIKSAVKQVIADEKRLGGQLRR